MSSPLSANKLETISPRKFLLSIKKSKSKRKKQTGEAYDSPNSNKTKLIVRGVLNGRLLRFDGAEKHESPKRLSLFSSFKPDYTSTPNYTLPKTSTPEPSILNQTHMNTPVKAANKNIRRPMDDNCHKYNSTFKDNIHLPITFLKYSDKNMPEKT